MAVFNFGGTQVNGDDAEGLAKAAQESGATFGGSIVAGTVHGVSGGTVTGNVYGTEEHDGRK